MSENEKLKEICDKIGYKNSEYEEYETFEWCIFIDSLEKCNLIPVREIIFTQEFIDKFRDFLYIKNNADIVKVDTLIAPLLNNLDDPVGYLYNLIK